MKILITTDVYSPTVNGVVTSIINLKQELTLRGHEVKVLTLSLDGIAHQEGEGYYLPSRDMGRIYPGARMAVVRKHPYIRELIVWKPDIVHSQSEFTSFSFARKIAGASKAALIHTYHTIYEDYTHYYTKNEKLGKSVAALLTRWLLKGCDAVIVPTVKVEALLKSYRVKAPIYVLPTGIAMDAFKEARMERKMTDGRLLGQPILITVGRVAKEKNLEEILQMLGTKRGERYHWLIVGDGPYREEFQAMVRKKGLSKRVIFTGMIPREKVAGYYQLGDVFVSASQSETQGLTYMEALASGLPVVARKDECLDGVILNGYNGWQYENTEEFFHALEELFPSNLASYGKVSGWQYEMCSENAASSSRQFSIGAFGLGAEKIYRKFLGQQRETDGSFLERLHPIRFHKM